MFKVLVYPPGIMQQQSSRFKWCVRLLVATALFLSGLVSMGSAQPAPNTLETLDTDSSAFPRACRKPLTFIKELRPEAERELQFVRLAGEVVDLDTWRALGGPVEINSWQLRFHSLGWLIPVARSAPSIAVQRVVDHARAFPDPGFPTARGRLGLAWTEGQIRRRLVTIQCLHKLTGDQRLIPIAMQLGDAIMDDQRYRGWPLYRPHNHGAQAILQLTAAGRHFDRPDWVAKSQLRARKDSARAFDACGMPGEQSSLYAWLNVTLWSRIARVTNIPEPRFASQAVRSLVRPDGFLEPIGDGKARNQPPSGATLWCPELGWAAGTDNGTHYSIRFGSSRVDHGHDDHGSITWFAAGVPVLTERATASKLTPEAKAASSRASSHSVFEVEGRKEVPAMTGERRGPRTFMLETSEPVPHTRTVTIGDRQLRVHDRASTSGDSGRWIQHWQLDARWQPVSGLPGRFTDSMGNRLSIDCRLDGTALPVRAVEVVSYVDQSSPALAWDAQCRTTGTDVDITTVISLTPADPRAVVGRGSAPAR